MKNYTKFLNERKAHKLTIQDSKELSDFLTHVEENMVEEPNLLRSAYARIQKILQEIRSGNCPKNNLISFFQTILWFVEGSGNNVDELKKKSEKFIEIDPSEYGVLLNIIHDYNHLVNRFKNDDFRNQVFNIRSWAFETEGIEPYEELTESYEDYCDFGCGHIATYLAENPDIDEDEFGEYVCQHNKADRDMGELQDVCEEEIERLGKEFKNQMVKEGKEDDIDKIYQNSLDDQYWKDISVRFPNCNSPNSDDNFKAVKYIYRNMKAKYPDEKWKLIGNQMEQKILDGIT